MTNSNTTHDMGGLTAESTGGENARRGFRYQDLWLLARVAELLDEDRFYGFRNEGADDAEIWYQDESTSTNIIDRYQLKDTTVGKSLLSDILEGFARVHTVYPGQWASFNLVASRCSREVEGVPHILRRLRHDKLSYGEDAAYYRDTHSTVENRLNGLGISTDVAFLRDFVEIELTHSEANSFHRTVKYAGALLFKHGVAPDRLEQACDALLSLISHKDGVFVERTVILDKLRSFEARVVTPSVPEFVERVTPLVVEDPTLVKPELVGQDEAFCRIQIVPGGAVIVELPGERFGVIDCGPRASRAVISYLQFRGVADLEFLAISHWHSDHYDGLRDVLDYANRVQHALIPDVSLLSTAHGDISRSTSRAVQLVTAFERRARSGESLIHVVSGGIRKFAFSQYGRELEAVAITSFASHAQAVDRRTDRMINQNNFCAVFLLEVGTSRFLITGDTELAGWKHILEYAQSAGRSLQSDGLVLPHHGSRQSMSSSLLQKLVKGRGFLAVVEPHQRFGLPDQETLDTVRALGGKIVVCDRNPVSLTVEPLGIREA